MTLTTLDAALDAVSRGWHVFPLRPGSKRPAGHNEDDCPRTGRCADGHRTWEQRATTDPGMVRACWTHNPRFGIGLATGPSGLCVLDLDIAKPGDEIPGQWAALDVRCGEDVLAVLSEQAGQPLPCETLTVRTPSGGLHLYFQVPGDATLRTTAGERGNGLGWKVDTRAWGGYVVGPGTVTRDGRYALLHDEPIAVLPGWLVERLTPAPPPAAPVLPIRPVAGRRNRYLEAAVTAEAGKVHDAIKSQRNAALYAAALALGQLVAGKALTADEVETRLVTAAGRHIACGAYSERQARATIRSGIRAGANRPRRVAS